jgi:RNA polymerase sigma-70 factor (ECF subfamily)
MSLTPESVSAEVPGLLRYAMALTRNPDEAADLVQDVVVRALERGATYRGDASVTTWLHRVMHHRYIDQVRARRDEPTDPDHLAEAVESAWRLDEYTVDAHRVVERAETAADLRDALVHLPALYRCALVLHDVEQMTAAQVAEVQQISLAAAKQRIRRGRMMLVSALASGAERRQALKGVPMRCWDARSQVSDYLDGELPGEQRSVLERHLEVCPTCPPLYAGLVGARDALSRLRDPDTVVPDSLATRLRAATEDTSGGSTPRGGA